MQRLTSRKGTLGWGKGSSLRNGKDGDDGRELHDLYRSVYVEMNIKCARRCRCLKKVVIGFQWDCL